MTTRVSVELVRLAQRDLSVEIEPLLLVDHSVQRPRDYVEIGIVARRDRATRTVHRVLGCDALKERFGRVNLVLHGTYDAVEQQSVMSLFNFIFI